MSLSFDRTWGAAAAQAWVLCLGLRATPAQAQTPAVPTPQVSMSAGERSRVEALVRAEADRLRRAAANQVALQRYERACYVLAAAQALAPDPAAYVQVGRTCQRAEHPQEARLLLDLLDDPPAHAGPRDEAYEAWRSEMANIEAVDAFQRVRLLREHTQSAQQAYDHEAPRLAADILSLLVLLAPDARSRILYNLAQCYRRMKQYEVAFALYERASLVTTSNWGSAEQERVLAEQAMQELLTTALKPSLLRRPWFLTTVALSAATLVAVTAIVARYLPNRTDTDAGYGTLRFP